MFGIRLTWIQTLAVPLGQVVQKLCLFVCLFACKMILFSRILVEIQRYVNV